MSRPLKRRPAWFDMVAASDDETLFNFDADFIVPDRMDDEAQEREVFFEPDPLLAKSARPSKS